MAPTKKFLADQSIQAALGKHDAHLIKQTTPVSRRGEKESLLEVQPCEKFELLSDYSGRFSDLEFREGKVTIVEAARATYGMTDGYLEDWIRGHLNRSSGFNKKYSTDGQVWVVSEDGSSVCPGRPRPGSASDQAGRSRRVAALRPDPARLLASWSSPRSYPDA